MVNLKYLANSPEALTRSIGSHCGRMRSFLLKSGMRWCGYLSATTDEATYITVRWFSRNAVRIGRILSRIIFSYLVFFPFKVFGIWDVEPLSDINIVHDSLCVVL